MNITELKSILSHLQRIIAPVQREIGVVIGVARLQLLLPLFPEPSRFPIVALRPLSGIVQASGGGFIVEQLREGGEDVQEPHPAQLQAEVHIVQGHREALVQASRRQVQFLFHQQAGPCHSGHVLGIAQPPHVAQVLAVLPVMGMPRRPVGPQPDHHPGVLDGLVRIVELGPHGPHVGPLGVHQKLLHPVDGDDFRVVVQQQYIFA